MAATKILAGASVRIDPLTFEHNLRSLRAQKLPPNVELDLHYVMDAEDDEKLIDLVQSYDGTWERAFDRPGDAPFAVDEQTHRWTVPTFEHLAQNKQRLLDKAVAERYDYVWIVDTDLVLDPTVLASALSLEAPVVNSTFWTQWQPGAPYLPQVWLAHPYVQSGKGMSQEEFWDKLANRKVVEVAGGGACMLVRTEVLEKVRYHPRLEGLPSDDMWQGEDRTFSLLCERSHIKQVADGWGDVFHAYRPSDREEEVLEDAASVLGASPQVHAAYGDLVNFTLSPLDDAKLKDATFPVRGRLGGLKLAPEIEQFLVSSEVGADGFVEISFPRTWPIQQLRGQRRIVRVNFVASKPYSYPPGISEHLFRGLR